MRTSTALLRPCRRLRGGVRRALAARVAGGAALARDPEFHLHAVGLPASRPSREPRRQVPLPVVRHVGRQRAARHGACAGPRASHCFPGSGTGRTIVPSVPVRARRLPAALPRSTPEVPTPTSRGNEPRGVLHSWVLEESRCRFQFTTDARSPYRWPSPRRPRPRARAAAAPFRPTGWSRAPTTRASRPTSASTISARTSCGPEPARSIAAASRSRRIARSSRRRSTATTTSSSTTRPLAIGAYRCRSRTSTAITRQSRRVTRTFPPPTRRVSATCASSGGTAGSRMTRAPACNSG